MMTKEEYINIAFRNNQFVSDDDKEEIYEIAKRELFITLYACNTSMINEDTIIPYAFEYKVIEAMREIIDMGNMRNFTSYQENGWSWTRPKNGLVSYQNINSKAMVY